jgi:hypothetical protein
VFADSSSASRGGGEGGLIAAVSTTGNGGDDGGKEGVVSIGGGKGGKGDGDGDDDGGGDGGMIHIRAPRSAMPTMLSPPRIAREPSPSTASSTRGAQRGEAAAKPNPTSPRCTRSRFALRGRRVAVTAVGGLTGQSYHCICLTGHSYHGCTHSRGVSDYTGPYCLSSIECALTAK